MSAIIANKYIINRNKPANYRDGDFNECLSEFQYSTYDVELIKLKYCFISIYGAIYENGIQLVKKSLIGPKHYNDYPLNRRLREIYKFEKIYLDNKEKYLVAFDAWSGGHYHWIAEVLPRLILIKDEIKNFTILLPDNEYVRTIGLSFLDLLGLKPKSVTFIKNYQLYFSNTIYLLSQVALTGYINDKILRTLKREIDNIILSRYKSDAIRKIYITREKAKNRKVLNDNEVKELFVTKGYDIITFEGLSLNEQIRICCSSGVMASIHGAALTNMIFMPIGSKILEFRRNKIFVNQCYWHLADSLGHKYFYFWGEPDSDLQIEGNGCNLTISVNNLSLLLDEIEKKKNIESSLRSQNI